MRFSLYFMARSHITLAALATAAVPGFDPVHAQAFSTGQHGDFFSAVVTDEAGRQLIVRVPNSAEAEAQLGAEKFALETMSAGIRSRLNFDAPLPVGKAALGKTFGLVFDFLPGTSLSLADFTEESALATSVGGAIASIHSLPTHFVSDAGLPSLSAAQVQRSVAETVSAAKATNLLPAALVVRWTEAMEDSSLWLFDPTVTHGSLGADSFLIGNDSVTGVLGWAALRVADPAADMSWVINSSIASQDAVFAAYTQSRHSLVDPKLRQRATLYSELELAKWLLHGVESQNAEVVDDAISMLDRLVDSVHQEDVNPIGTETAEVLSVTEVVELLEETPGDSAQSYKGMPPVSDNQRSSNSLSE
jgi:aminoglycoside phosphotransferase (APT) family kinase protein